MTSNIYHQLQEQLDQYSVGFPSTPSGVEIKILEKLFTEEEARMYLELNLTLETSAAVEERTNQDPEIVSSLLERMKEKGLIFSVRKDESTRYAAADFNITKKHLFLALSHPFHIKNGSFKTSKCLLLERYHININRIAWSSAGLTPMI